jgi:hypothetical protein
MYRSKTSSEVIAILLVVRQRAGSHLSARFVRVFSLPRRDGERAVNGALRKRTTSATTTSTARSNRSCSGVPGERTSAGSRSNRTMALKPGTANQDPTAATKKVAWDAKAAGSGATTASQCRWSTRSRSSTRCWRPPMTRMMPAVLATEPTVLATMGRSKRRCCGHCRPSRSTPHSHSRLMNKWGRRIAGSA